MYQKHKKGHVSSKDHLCAPLTPVKVTGQKLTSKNILVCRFNTKFNLLGSHFLL